MKLKSIQVIHPFLFAIYPVVFLFSHNMVELSLLERSSILRIVVPTAMLLCLTCLLMGLMNIFFGNRQKTGIIVSLFLFLFFSYGHSYNITVDTLGDDILFIIAGFYVEYYMFYYSACLILFILVTYLLRRTRRNLSTFTQFLNITTGVLVIVSLVNIGFHEIRRATLPETRNIERIEANSTDADPTAIFPDIYYIVLDEYAAASTLKEHYHYDNQKFLDSLTEKGFYIASKSRSNYPFTTLSFPSFLNLEYMNYLRDRLDVDETVLIQMTKDNKVMRFLKSKGYKLIHFRTGYAPTERNPYADWDVECDQTIVKDRFIRLFIQSTVLEPFLRRYTSTSKREKIQCQFSTLAQLHKIKEPIFVLAHILAPHWPYVFGANGEEVSEEDHRTVEEKQLYLNQLIFITKKLELLINEILSKAEKPPIIIVQSDTGPWINPPIEKGYDRVSIIGRMRILSAYYLPGGGDALLYETITPVNTFRIIFNYYFGTNYELLDDQSYYAEPWITPYKFTNLTDIVKYD